MIENLLGLCDLLREAADQVENGDAFRRKLAQIDVKLAAARVDLDIAEERLAAA